MTAELTPISEGGYCVSEDVMSKVVNVTLPDEVSAATFIADAAKLINNALSKKYEVPIVTTDAKDLNLLETINAYLAAGLMVESVAVATESEEIHAAAMALIKRGMVGFIVKDTTVTPGLKSLVEGEYLLNGATLLTDEVAADAYVGISSPTYKKDGVTKDQSYFTEFYPHF